MNLQYRVYGPLTLDEAIRQESLMQAVRWECHVEQAKRLQRLSDDICAAENTLGWLRGQERP